MRVERDGGAGRAATAESLLDAAAEAFLRAEFDIVRPLLQRLRGEFGVPEADPARVRYDVLLGALAARAGNWRETVRRCPDAPYGAETGIVHHLAVSALRELAREGRHTDAGTAAVVIVLWAYLLEEEDLGGFRDLLGERRGAPVPDELWEQGLAQLRGRVADLLRAQDARAGRDALSAWHTAWEAECQVGAVFVDDVPTDAGPHALVSLEEAARQLAHHGRGADLLAVWTARHPEVGAWTGDSAEHRACAPFLRRALTDRGGDRVRAGAWAEALADFGAAVRLGHTLVTDERADVLRAGRNVGRSRTGRDYSPLVRIDGLEQALVLLPQDGHLAAELTAELVRQARRTSDTDPGESRRRYARALAVTPGDPAALAGLDEQVRADLERADRGAYRGDPISADEVRGLLGRHPGDAAARRWLENHYAEHAVTAAVRGRTDEARGAVRALLHQENAVGAYDADRVDDRLRALLVEAAGDVGTGIPLPLTGRGTERGRRVELERRVALEIAAARDRGVLLARRADAERRAELLAAAAAIPGPPSERLVERADEAVHHLALYLQAEAAWSDIVGLFLRGRIRTGADPALDRIVQLAYRCRAGAREEAGDAAGAAHDRACAEAVRAGKPAGALVFRQRPPGSRPGGPGSGSGAGTGSHDAGTGNGSGSDAGRDTLW
ncbi:hypothetical protein ACF1BN_03140 [Streptomyces sp. NPDC014861]|uniref:hypothetical protein n=1 Tax=Streptomyces sp. NPDC014861 TaxID=3364923 RepID=UPI003700A875